jgi:hypothetical protein
MPDEPIEPPPIEEQAAPPVQVAYDYSQPPTPMSPVAPYDPMGNVIPTKNPKALAAYYCGVFSLIPCVTILVLAPAAIYLGLQGLKAVREMPGLPGKVHAIVGIVLGSVMLLLSVGLVIFVLAFGRWS